MTNWFAVHLPQFLAPTLDGPQACALHCSNLPTLQAHADISLLVHHSVLHGIFRGGLSLNGFCRLFYLDNPELVANKKSRWFKFLKAARDGRLLERPTNAPLWQPHKLYQPQMPDRLQSGYEDVEHELREMTAFACANKVSVLFVAGDGLALMRLNHLLKNKPDQFIDMAPVIIPIQGIFLYTYI